MEGLSFAGKELLIQVLERIALEKPENSAILLEAYRDSPHEKTVRALAGLELDVPIGGEMAEFSGAMAQLLRQARQERLSELLAKEGREGLSIEEKQVLREWLKQRM
jgi:DNA primase